MSASAVDEWEDITVVEDGDWNQKEPTCIQDLNELRLKHLEQQVDSLLQSLRVATDIIAIHSAEIERLKGLVIGKRKESVGVKRN